MSEVAIKVEGLGKQYKIGSQKASYRTLRDTVVETISAPFKRAADLLHGKTYGASGLDQSIWALRNINFEVTQGEVIGVIGPNGAGKSTLLKLLTRITEPTEGQAFIRGRVGSLLEVGTGFHPELTGRENIYLNGSILGMHREEIKQKFDEIVNFSGVEKFIDTPVKHYSSGMSVRLAFSVAAHLDTEILLVDEVLAVGDASFRSRSLDKMKDVTGEGRTVLFVSHDLPAVENMCEQAILLDKGSLIYSGESRDVINHYLGLKISTSNSHVDLSDLSRRDSSSKPIFRGITIKNSKGQPDSNVEIGEDVIIELSIDSLGRNYKSPMVHIHVKNQRGVSVARLLTDVMGAEKFVISGPLKLRCKWKNIRLSPGLYSISLLLKDKGMNIDGLEDVAMFEVPKRDIYGTGKYHKDPGLLMPDGTWEIDC